MEAGNNNNNTKKQPTRAGAPAAAAAAVAVAVAPAPILPPQPIPPPLTPVTPAAAGGGGPGPVDSSTMPSGPVQAPSVRGQNATATHGTELPVTVPVPARRPDQRSSSSSNNGPSYSSSSSSTTTTTKSPSIMPLHHQTTEPPRKKRARTERGAPAPAGNDSDEERQEAMDMVERHNAGQPVLSGPAALGLEENSSREEQTKGTAATATTTSTTGGRTAAHNNGSGQLVQKSSGQVQKSSPTSEGVNLWGTSIWDPEDETDMYWEHGRRYARDYFMPNDEDEQDRLRILHQIYLNIFNLELTTIPLESPTAVLDVGTGTGEWSMGMAERWPGCEVTGVDISPTFERAVPLNCHFEVLDGEVDRPWPWADDTFDMVHYRHMSGAFRDWNAVYGETLRCLKPGGWVEILEFHDHEGEKNFYDRFPPHSLMHKAARDIERAELLHGKHRGIDHMEPDLLEANGLVACEVHEHIIPLDPSNSPLGKLWLVTLRAGFESYALRLLTKYMGWDAASVRMACESVGQQMIAMATNPAMNKGFQIRLRVTIARKPLLTPFKAEEEESTPPPVVGIPVAGGRPGVRDHDRDAAAFKTSPPSGESPSDSSPFPAVPGTQHIYPNTAAQPRPPI
ncbi:hypothetical protein VMCG_00802 [Cytospora schulzeri]|uniref:Methyltransferase domain-containing protein n=1 Tax=Cytospora schulzeri TaxID=448051 RepID=A0A423X8Q9_9PEZI|nr:hypothetical protein VMCG_00802 [Valsa malicola]